MYDKQASGNWRTTDRKLSTKQHDSMKKSNKQIHLVAIQYC